MDLKRQVKVGALDPDTALKLLEQGAEHRDQALKSRTARWLRGTGRQRYAKARPDFVQRETEFVEKLKTPAPPIPVRDDEPKPRLSHKEQVKASKRKKEK